MNRSPAPTACSPFSEVNRDGSAGTALLGLPGFRLLAVSQHHGEIEQAVESIVEQDWCSSCGSPRSRTAGGWCRFVVCLGRLPVTLLWIKRLWRCAEAACPRRAWSETREHVRSRASLTEPARREACRLVGEDGLDVGAVADLVGVGWSTIMRAVRKYGRPLVEVQVTRRAVRPDRPPRPQRAPGRRRRTPPSAGRPAAQPAWTVRPTLPSSRSS